MLQAEITRCSELPQGPEDAKKLYWWYGSKILSLPAWVETNTPVGTEKVNTTRGVSPETLGRLNAEMVRLGFRKLIGRQVYQAINLDVPRERADHHCILLEWRPVAKNRCVVTGYFFFRGKLSIPTVKVTTFKNLLTYLEHTKPARLAPNLPEAQGMWQFWAREQGYSEMALSRKYVHIFDNFTKAYTARQYKKPS